MDRENSDPSKLKWLILSYLLFVFLSLLYYMGDSYGIMMKTLLEVGTANIIVSIGIIFWEIVSVLHIVHFHRNPPEHEDLINFFEFMGPSFLVVLFFNGFNPIWVSTLLFIHYLISGSTFLIEERNLLYKQFSGLSNIVMPLVIYLRYIGISRILISIILSLYSLFLSFPNIKRTNHIDLLEK